jgi:D-lactate dehydrogenase (cytochrome)
MAMKHVPGIVDPLAEPHAWYVLLDVSSSQVDSGLRGALETFLAETLEADLIQDGAIAASGAQAGDLWRIREGMVEAQKYEGGSIKHDISVPVSRVATFITRALAAVAQLTPDARALAFGHVGDGNIHFNISQPVGGDSAAFLALWPEVNHLVHDIAAALGGSISAEHGIGRLKRDELPRYKSAIELALMRQVKQALDPQGIMNPGKVLQP